MPRLKWGRPGERTYEAGVDQGVLYLPDNSAVVWNGLVAVTERQTKERDPIFYDGMKVSDQVTPGDYAATVRAVHYPPEFDYLSTTEDLRSGVRIGGQESKTFGMSYRTMKGSDVNRGSSAYKIHLIYNLSAVPSDIDYETLSDSPSIAEFEWDVEAIPEEIPGFRPSAHFTFESDRIDPWLMEELETILYGGEYTLPRLPTMEELVNFIVDWARVRIVVDEEAGTWTAMEIRPGFILQDSTDYDVYHLRMVNAIYLNDAQEIYLIKDTKDPTNYLEVRDNMNGTWTVITDSDAMIEIVDGKFTLRDIELLISGSDIFRIESNKNRR